MVTDKQKRIKIAELLGAKLLNNPTTSGPEKLWSFGSISPGDVFAKMWICGEEDALLPDYLNDFNAMHEALKVMDKYQCHDFNEWILVLRSDISFNDDISQPSTRWTWGQPIKIIVEAFGRTMKLW